MKKLSDCIKNDYSDKDIINMFFREKFGDVTDRIYTHDAALLPSIFQQAEAAGMATNTGKFRIRRRTGIVCADVGKKTEMCADEVP